MEEARGILMLRIKSHNYLALESQTALFTLNTTKGDNDREMEMANMSGIARVRRKQGEREREREAGCHVCRRRGSVKANSWNVTSLSLSPPPIFIYPGNKRK